MKKILLSLSLLFAVGHASAQTTVFSYGFDGVTADLTTAGWIRTNQSSPSTASLWTIASYETYEIFELIGDFDLPFNDVNLGDGEMTPVPNGHQGGENSFALVNFNSTTGNNTISNWLITPEITVQNGDVVTFYTRIGKDVTPNDPDASFADRLEFRMSSGSSHITPVGSTDSGSYQTVLAEVNPNLTLTDYPTSWTAITSTITGLNGPTPVKFAFRYYVTNGGPSGDNSDIIGIDTFSVTRPAASTEDFVKNNFAVYPNPATDALNLNAKSNATINSVSITDVNGRTVKQQQFSGVSSAQINVSNLNAGVYFIAIDAAEGKGTTKFVKN